MSTILQISASKCHSLIRNPLERLVLLQQVDENLDGKRAKDSIVELEGYIGFYKDLVYQLCIETIHQSITHAFHHSTRDFFDRHDPDHKSNLIQLGRTGLTYVTASAVTYPLETIRYRSWKDVGRHNYSNILDCTRSALEQDGVMELYRGFGLSTLQFVCHRYISYTLANWIYDFGSARNSSFTDSISPIIVGFSSAMTRFILYPLNTFIRRSQVLGVENVSTHNLYNGVGLAVASQIVSESLRLQIDKML